jgi:hypothetical protein
LELRSQRTSLVEIVDSLESSSWGYDRVALLVVWVFGLCVLLESH